MILISTKMVNLYYVVEFNQPVNWFDIMPDVMKLTQKVYTCSSNNTRSHKIVICRIAGGSKIPTKNNKLLNDFQSFNNKNIWKNRTINVQQHIKSIYSHLGFNKHMWIIAAYLYYELLDAVLADFMASPEHMEALYTPLDPRDLQAVEYIRNYVNRLLLERAQIEMNPSVIASVVGSEEDALGTLDTYLGGLAEKDLEITFVGFRTVKKPYKETMERLLKIGTKTPHEYYLEVRDHIAAYLAQFHEEDL